MEGNLYRQEALVELLHIRGYRSGVSVGQRYRISGDSSLYNFGNREGNQIDKMIGCGGRTFIHKRRSLSVICHDHVRMSVSSSTPSTND
jgi:hypothetical protein